MQRITRCIMIFAFPAIIAAGIWENANLFAQRILSGAELESGCQVYSDKSVKMAKEWENRECGKKLDLYPQIMDTEKDWHLRRCRNSVGTSIAADLKLMEDYLAQCPGKPGKPTDYEGDQEGRQGGNTGQQGGWQRRPEPMTGTDSRRRNPIVKSGEEIWDLVVINSADLQRSDHSFVIPSLNGIFAARNMLPNGPDFRGQMNGSVFEAVMTDSTGYRGTFIGHGAGWGVIEGTGCDNRNRSYSFTMKRR